MMREVKVLLESIDRVKKFVSITNGFDTNMDLVRGRYTIDAKSLLGIFSMDLSKPLVLQVHAQQDEAEEILKAIQDYVVG